MNSRTKWSRVWWGLASFKAGYFIAILLALNFWGDLGEFVRLPQRWPRQGGPTFASHFAGWDAGYYLSLSEDGYTAGDQACAFYPLWPLLIRWFSVLTGGNHLIAGMVLANVFSLAAWIIFYHVAARRFGEKTAWWALVLLIIFPGSLFYQFIYSEPLFFLLVMVLWLGLEQNRYGLAWSAAFLLPLTRGIGIFAVLPIAWHAFEPAGAWFKNRVGQAVRRFGPGWKSILLWGRTRCDGRNGVRNDFMRRFSRPQCG